MKEPPKWLMAYLLNRYRKSSYADFLEMRILELHEGEITLSMLVRHELTNLKGILHGGAAGSILDMAMNFACFSLGRRASILGFNTNFLRGCKEGKTVRAVARILHSGRRTMVVEGEIIDPESKLLAKARGTFLATGQYMPDNLSNTGASLPAPHEGLRSEPFPLVLPQKTQILTGQLQNILLQAHDHNYFAKYLGMEIKEIGEGKCVVSMLVTDRHINTRNVVHGGALVSLGDMSMMLACASLARQTVTLDLNINFVRRVTEGMVVTSFPQVIYQGKSTMVVRSIIFDKEEKLLAETRGTFFITGDYTTEEQ